MSEARMDHGPMLGIEAVKAGPPVAVSAATAVGAPTPDWVVILTIVYLALQIGLLLPKYWERFKEWRGR